MRNYKWRNLSQALGCSNEHTQVLLCNIKSAAPTAAPSLTVSSCIAQLTLLLALQPHCGYQAHALVKLNTTGNNHASWPAFPRKQTIPPHTLHYGALACAFQHSNVITQLPHTITARQALRANFLRLSVTVSVCQTMPRLATDHALRKPVKGCQR